MNLKRLIDKYEKCSSVYSYLLVYDVDSRMAKKKLRGLRKRIRWLKRKISKQKIIQFFQKTQEDS